MPWWTHRSFRFLPMVGVDLLMLKRWNLNYAICITVSLPVRLQRNIYDRDRQIVSEGGFPSQSLMNMHVRYYHAKANIFRKFFSANYFNPMNYLFVPFHFSPFHGKLYLANLEKMRNILVVPGKRLLSNFFFFTQSLSPRYIILQTSAFLLRVPTKRLHRTFQAVLSEQHSQKGTALKVFYIHRVLIQELIQCTQLHFKGALFDSL